ncbi:protein BASIC PENTACYSTEINE7-like [Typha latifolia]|uniref:protein BASIC PENTACYSTEINE7-like n=1 Tax=Typha latifolia TaxID=4733 RepID=UPI003C302181
MDGRGRLGQRSWEFSDQDEHADLMLKHGSSVPVPYSVISGHHETSLKMSCYPDRDSVVGERNSEASAMDFSWISQRTKNIVQASPISSAMIDTRNMTTTTEELQNGEFKAKPQKVKKQQSSTKKDSHVATKALRPKEPKKRPSGSTKKKGSSVPSGRREKKNQESGFEGVLNFSSVPPPVCSCTGVSRQCYRWGSGGWQSSCCTTSISEYPLPMSPSRPGARLAGRKMSIGAYGKLLQRLAAEGHDLSYAVDLKDHWARHGTNKFVTIR